MNNTPNGLRRRIVLIGPTNAGKSTLMNRLTNTDISLVSSIAGTTTDPVIKGFEIIGYGPVTLVDTAGFFDDTNLGELRLKKTMLELRQADLAIVIINHQTTMKDYESMIEVIDGPFITLVNGLERQHGVTDALVLDVLKDDLAPLIEAMIQELPKTSDEYILPHFKKRAHVLLVTPIDSEAPKGRLILPQVQTIRDALDQHFITTIVQIEELAYILESGITFDCIVTDSQAFKQVSQIVPMTMPLTSFSILMAAQKADIQTFIDGLSLLHRLEETSTVAIVESCNHNRSHEDIACVKIPKALEQILGFKPNLVYYNGSQYLDDLNQIDFVIHCGACMITKKAVQAKVDLLQENNIPVANFGLILAYASGIVERAIKPLNN